MLKELRLRSTPTTFNLGAESALPLSADVILERKRWWQAKLDADTKYALQEEIAYWRSEVAICDQALRAIDQEQQLADVTFERNAALRHGEQCVAQTKESEAKLAEKDEEINKAWLAADEYKLRAVKAAAELAELKAGMFAAKRAGKL